MPESSDLPLAAGYTIRTASLADAQPVHDLTAVSDLEEFGEAEGYTVEEIEDEWSGLDLDRDTWLVIAPDGSLAGYAALRDRGHVRVDVEGYVHPRHFGHGIGTTLLRLTESRAREHIPLAPHGAQVVLHNWISATNAAACTLLEREGYAPVRYFLRMEATLDEEPSAPEWPDGTTVRTFVSDDDTSVFHALVEEAWADHWGYVPTPLDEWKQRRLGQTFDPSLWFLVEAGGEPAAAALCSVADGVGWVDTLAVRRTWRRQGLGKALLRQAAVEFHRRGLTRMALGVDAASPTGATRLYERAGMRVTQQHATYGKELQAGRDPLKGA